MSKREAFLDPAKEALAVKALKEGLAGVGEGDDAELLSDTIEGETSFFEIIDELLLRRTTNLALADGITGAIEALKTRKTRFEVNAERDKALIEQALAIAELDTLARPVATLSMSRRAPSVVITEESEIPAEFWKPGTPSLDKKALAEAVKARAAALAIEDPDARAAALAEAPEVPGATLNNAAPSLTIRVR